MHEFDEHIWPDSLTSYSWNSWSNPPRIRPWAYMRDLLDLDFRYENQCKEADFYAK